MFVCEIDVAVFVKKKPKKQRNFCKVEGRQIPLPPKKTQIYCQQKLNGTVDSLEEVKCHEAQQEQSCLVLGDLNADELLDGLMVDLSEADSEQSESSEEGWITI